MIQFQWDFSYTRVLVMQPGEYLEEEEEEELQRGTPCWARMIWAWSRCPPA